MQNKMNCQIWDENRNIYDFIQVGEKITVKSGDNLVYEGTLLQIKEIDIGSRRPIILKDELFIKDYWKSGYERHKLNGSERRFSDNWADYVILYTNNNALLPKESTWQIWDDQKDFYEFNQIDQNITLTKGGKIFFESKLLKKLAIGSPNMPKIINDELYVFDYDKGFEIHKLDGSDRKFFNNRAAWDIVEAGTRLFFVNRIRLMTFDVIEKKVVEEKATSESFSIYKCSDGYLLFYRYKNLKSYLYNINTKEFTELPKFSNKLDAIINVIMEDNKLIAFYFSGKQPNKPSRGVYIYDIDTLSDSFYCELQEHTGCGGTYSDLLNYSFNTLDDEKKISAYGDDYSKYLYFILKKFGFYAFLCYANTERFSEENLGANYNQIKDIYEYYDQKLCNLPASNEEYQSLLNEMKASENKLEKLIRH